MKSARYMLALAARRVNAVVAQAPGPVNLDEIGDDWVHLQAEVETALTAGDEVRARKAIEAWESHTLAELRGVER